MSANAAVAVLPKQDFEFIPLAVDKKYSVPLIQRATKRGIC